MPNNMKQSAANQNCADAMRDASNDGLMEMTTVHDAGHNLLPQANAMLQQANAALKQAASLTATGQYGAAMKLAYAASELIAAAYLANFTDQQLAASDKAYLVFAKLIQDSKEHDEFLPRIWDIVGDVTILREAYEPALLDETTTQDAQQMIEHVAALLELVADLLQKT
jgi:HEPN domain-containing protein